MRLFEVTEWLEFFLNSSENFMQIPLKVNKIFFLWHQAWPHNDLLLLKTKVQYLWYTYLWPPIPWQRKTTYKKIIKAMATKFSEIFATSMLKMHRKFCRRGFTHLAATPTFKNRPNTYGPPSALYEWYFHMYRSYASGLICPPFSYPINWHFWSQRAVLIWASPLSGNHRD